MGNLEGVLNYYKAKLTCRPAGATRAKISQTEILRSRVWLRAGQTDDRSSGKSIPGTERDRRSAEYSFHQLISRPIAVFPQSKVIQMKSVICCKIMLCVYPLVRLPVIRRILHFGRLKGMNGRFGYLSMA